VTDPAAPASAGLDPAAVADFLAARAPGLGVRPPLTAGLIAGGLSNLTYELRDADGRAWVLRRPPLGHVLPTAHDMRREFRVISALCGTVPVARAYVLCEDPDVIGAPFYVMEKVEGHVVAFDIPEEIDGVAERRRMSEELIDALVEVHAVDWQACGLEGFGKPTGYLERQLRRFNGLWEHNKTRDIPQVETVGTWLADNLPESGPATVVHGDFRLGNVMYAPEKPPRLNAIFDWEMATIGDPLADLGYLCMTWSEATDPEGGLSRLSAVTRQEGFPTRAEMVERYRERSGRPVGDLRWYLTLATWKSVVFMEGNYKRAQAGSTDDPFLKSFGEGVVEIAERAEEFALGI
jgi:aminoglycoside phosphotransferase (APT) family kinase protein